MQHAAFGVHLIEFHGAGLGYPQAMPEHEKQQAPVEHLVPAALGGLNQLLNLPRGEMLALTNLHPPPDRREKLSDRLSRASIVAGAPTRSRRRHCSSGRFLLWGRAEGTTEYSASILDAMGILPCGHRASATNRCTGSSPAKTVTLMRNQPKMRKSNACNVSTAHLAIRAGNMII